MFADDAKIFQVIKSLNDYVALQKRFILGLSPKFNILKCKLLHFGPCHQYA